MKIKRIEHGWLISSNVDELIIDENDELFFAIVKDYIEKNSNKSDHFSEIIRKEYYPNGERTLAIIPIDSNRWYIVAIIEVYISRPNKLFINSIAGDIRKLQKEFF